MSVNFRTAMPVSTERVANIFFFTLNDVFSKWGCSTVPGNESAICLNVSMETMGW